MADDFLAALMGNAARARLLRIFVLNPDETFTLAQLSKRANVTARTALREIRALEKLEIVKQRSYSIAVRATGKNVSSSKQREATWAVDMQAKHVEALSKFIHQISPMRHSIILEKLRRAGRLSAVILSGSFVGDASRPADILIAGDDVSEKRLDAAVRALEPLYGREIRYAVFTTPEFRYRLTIQDRLIRDTLDFPHLILLDRAQLL
jgi:DNA-binding Lrp family transcriptional regulator